MSFSVIARIKSTIASISRVFLYNNSLWLIVSLYGDFWSYRKKLRVKTNVSPRLYNAYNQRNNMFIGFMAEPPPFPA